MSVAHAPRAHVHRPHVNWWLVAVVGLAAALVGLATWVLVDRYTGSDVSADATTLIDDFDAAGSAHDAAAVAALLTPNAVMWSDGETIAGANRIAEGAATTGGLFIERTAPVSVDGDFATTFTRWTIPVAGVDNAPTLQVFQLKGGKIARIRVFGLWVTAPFDTVAP